MQLTRDLFAIAKFLFLYGIGHGEYYGINYYKSGGLVVSTSANDCLERLISKIVCYVTHILHLPHLNGDFGLEEGEY